MTKKKEVDLKTIDRSLIPPKVPTTKKKKEIILPDTSNITWPKKSFIVDAQLADLLLQDVNMRKHGVSDKVVYLGSKRQHAFIILLCSWLVKTKGILYIPEVLFKSGQLEGWRKCTQSKCPEGFITLRRAQKNKKRVLPITEKIN